MFFEDIYARQLRDLGYEGQQIYQSWNCIFILIISNNTKDC